MVRYGCGVVLTTLVFDILVASRIVNVLVNDRFSMTEQDIEPQGDNKNCHTVGDIQNGLILELGTDRDGSNDEARVGENHSPERTQMKVLRWGVHNLFIC
jgi:hypothetical protein